MFKRGNFRVRRIAAILVLIASPLVGAQEQVDLQLILSADVSGSMSRDAYELQRNGMIEALRDGEVKRMFAQAGPIGKVAVMYFEWGSFNRIAIPWIVLHKETIDADVEHFTEKLQKVDFWAGNLTTLGASLLYIRQNILANSPFQSERIVLDISGDGESNSGIRPEGERDLLVDAGVTINGIVYVRADLNIRSYYQDHVTGGVGSFVLEVHEPSQFHHVFRRKLLTEIAWRPPAGLKSSPFSL